LPLPLLLKVSAELKRGITDAWVMKLGGLHLIEMISTWQDMDNQLVTANLEEITKYAQTIAESDRLAAA
jgi:hypothetical protein